MQLFPDHSVFEPGRVMWDHFDELDPTRALGDQESLWGCEDPFAVEYPSGALLDVSYLGDVGDMHRVVVVVIAPGVKDWTPAVKRECGTFEELQKVVLELNALAKEWKS